MKRNPKKIVTVENKEQLLMGTKNLFQKFEVKTSFRITVLVLIIGGITGSIYYYQQYQVLKQNPNIEAQKETNNLISKVGKFMDLPSGETPTVATVLDKEKLKDQSFFKNAENGDKLLAYIKAMKAILYRPSTNKVIEFAPIYINQQASVGVK